MNKKVIPFDLTPAVALKNIKRLAADSSNIFILEHAQKRMKKRHITLEQVIDCLRKGRIIEGPYREIGAHNWRVKLEHYVAGQHINVVAELFINNNNEKVLVITAFFGG